jgi:prepilin-type N-terminal cleavage/methylation domain-containing protein
VILRDEGGYSLVELLVVMAILGVVVGGVTTLFARGINADAQQTARFQSQQDLRVAMDRMRREIHAACTISSPGTYNSPVSSVTLYFPSDSCASGSHAVSWCTTGSAGRYALYRIVSTSCTGATQMFADYLTAASIFTYLPPNSHLGTLNGGAGAITTQDNSFVLPRLHVDMTISRGTRNAHPYRVWDDIAFRNGPRACGTGVASC